MHEWKCYNSVKAIPKDDKNVFSRNSNVCTPKPTVFISNQRFALANTI